MRTTTYVKGMAIALLVIVNVGLVGSTYVISALNVKWRVVRILTFYGTFVYLLGLRAKETDAIIARTIAIILWCVAFLCFLFMS